MVPVMVLVSFTMMGRAADLPGIPPETVTDYIHAVIEADRTVYTVHVVERMDQPMTRREKGSTTAAT